MEWEKKKNEISECAIHRKISHFDDSFFEFE